MYSRASRSLKQPNVLKQLAALENEQWVEWSKDMASTETLSAERLKRWRKFWRPYARLPEDVKEQNREWGREGS